MTDLKIIELGDQRGIEIGFEDITVEQIRKLIDDGIDINTRDATGITGLMMASMYSNPEIINTLIEAGASATLNATTPFGSTALMFALLFNKIENALALIVAGANVNAQAIDGGTALHLASKKGSVAVVKALIAAGAKTEGPDAETDYQIKALLRKNKL
jgi:ankyrin repeat protein